MKIDDNILNMDNGSQLRFEKTIEKAEAINDKILVLLQASDNSDLDELYCFSKNRQLLWRIQPPEQKFFGKIRSPYVGFSYGKGQYWVVDFVGRLFYFDINTGIITDMKVVR